MNLAILLVEDNPDDVELALEALHIYNVANEVIIRGDGAEALDYLLDPHCQLPAVVLLDLKLPKIDGLEVLRRIRSNDRTRLLPVVILTSSREERDVLEAYSLTVNSYIVKPVDFEQFTESVRHIGMYWLLMNEPPPIPRLNV